MQTAPKRNGAANPQRDAGRGDPENKRLPSALDTTDNADGLTAQRARCRSVPRNTDLSAVDPGWQTLGQAADDIVATLPARRRGWLMLKARMGAAEAERISRFVFGEGC